MPPRKLPPSAPAESDSDRLLDVVVYLSQQAGILIDLIDEVREDLSWLTRNGVAHQPLLVRVDRMARDPLASDWGERLKVSVVEVEPRLSAGSVVPSNSQIESLIDVLADPLGQVAPEKLAMVISLLDFVKHEVSKAIRSPSDQLATSPTPTPLCEPEEPLTMPRSDRQERRSAPRGHLF